MTKNRISIPAHLITLSGLLYCLLPLPALSADSLCKTPSYQPILDNWQDKGDKTQIQADKVDIQKEGVSVFTGNVDVLSPSHQLKADRVEYQQSTNLMSAFGNINLGSKEFYITGKSAEFDLTNNTGQIEHASYASTSRGYGNADRIDIKGKGKVSLTNASYTTCDPEQVDWLLSASEINLNNEIRQGTAKNVVVRFKNIPFFYFPYLRFPIGEERLSGFLFPSIGSSDENGIEVKVPYYWNIDPQFDATITPWYLSKRGTMLQNEFRYLTHKSSGQFNIDYLEGDEIYNDDRMFAHWEHKGKPAKGWSTMVDYNYVADNLHLQDFSTDLENISQTHLNRQAMATYNTPRWSFLANVQRFQTLSTTEPYRREPQLRLLRRDFQKDNQFNFHFDSELTQFDHRYDVIKGTRFDMQPAISYPLTTAATYLVPRLSVYYTQYQLENTAVGQEENPSRTIPGFSVNSGVIFERDTSMFGTAMQQTLEPQLLYLYRPYEDQSGLPVFDTSLYNFNINNPFATDRFIGRDRIGDTNQLTAALATRFYRQDNGSELLSARIGQVLYFDDRKVTLPGGTIETGNHSNFVAELITRPNPAWYLGSDVEWDQDNDDLIRGNARISYQNEDKFQLLGNYRFIRNDLRTAELGFRWRLSPRWRLTARSLKDIEADSPLEEQAEIRYDSCCWGLSLQWQERFDTTNQTYDQGIFLQLELKGLSNIGQHRKISGFD